MSNPNPLHAKYCADRGVQTRTALIENVPLAKDTFRVRFDCPSIASRITPGQFVMIRLAGCDDPLLARPLAMYDTVCAESGDAIGLDVVYLVAGKFTRRLSACIPGQLLDVWGPLGNGFPPQPVDHMIMVAGGIGQTPFLALAAEHLGRKPFGNPAREVPRPKRITFCYGARSAEYLAGLDDFRRLGIDIQISTDDGSAGHHGFITDLLTKLLAEPFHGKRQIACCGPEAMMHAVAKIAHSSSVPCQVSLETPMACGIGICFTCVAKVRQGDGDWDYKRTCVEGPIFDADKIIW
ncbi:MAG TPA: dihydroorotate dehydrogenase electron transfer subunit [Pirellulales bacterium]